MKKEYQIIVVIYVDDIIFEGWIVHNYLIDIRVASIVTPKVIVKEMNLYYTRCV